MPLYIYTKINSEKVVTGAIQTTTSWDPHKYVTLAVPHNSLYNNRENLKHCEGSELLLSIATLETKERAWNVVDRESKQVSNYG